MKLTAYDLEGQSVAIRPAPVERAWMDATHQRFAYRCLPLNIANAHGWEILCRSGFTASWNGRPAKEDLYITPDPGTKAPATSHFATGILTFHLACIFRTEPGFDLVAQGPMNRPKDGIYPLTGVIETDWATATFTMNWIFTRPGMVRFEKDEPFCHIFPIRRSDMETVEPGRRPISAAPELEQSYASWKASRTAFNKDLKEPGSKAQADRWQKDYYRGQDLASGDAAPADHRTRVRLKAFED